MINNMSTILKHDLEYIFTEISKNTSNNIKNINMNTIFVTGKINNPQLIELKDNMSLEDIINKCSGTLNKKSVKLVQYGVPFGKILNSTFNRDILLKNDKNVLIILTEDDCIVQYLKNYINCLINYIKYENIEKYKLTKDIFLDIYKILDKISKGRANIVELNNVINHCKKLEKFFELPVNLIEDVIKNYYDEFQEHIANKRCATSQCSHLTKINITEKCIGCGACKRVCPVDCIYGEKKEKHNINYEECTHCGACYTVCPVNAITVGNINFKFLNDIINKDKVVITQMAPAVRVAIGEAFGFDSGVNIEKKVASALRKIGVDYVFDTTYGADLTIIEEAAEFQERLKKYLAGDKNVKIPMFTSCCPAWVKFMEQNHPEMLDSLSTAKSPIHMFGAVAKHIWSKEKNIDNDNLVSVAILPCTAKKYEVAREEFSTDLNYDVDYVITTTELIDLFKSLNIDLSIIEEEEIDLPLGEYSGAGIIFGRTGGVIEAVTRTTVEEMTNKRLENIEFEELRGYEGCRVCDVEVEDLKLRIGIVHGLKEAQKLIEKVKNNEEFFHAIEVMACPCGCIGGGGQPKIKNKKELSEKLEKRAEGLNDIDRNLYVRRAQENPKLIKLYNDHLEKPLSHKAHELLHTKFFDKSIK